MYVERIGAHVKPDIVPLRRWLDHGVPVGCGTDWGPRNVFEQIALAETCEFAGSGYRNLDVGQAVTREQAILMWTRDAARVLGWSGVGSLAPRHHADLTIVDRDPYACAIEDLPGTRVLATLVDGRVTHQTGTLKLDALAT
jgi:predicted amidohydrolase YtcJ